MNIDKVKLYLKDYFKAFVLEDMTGPCDLQGGMAFVAKRKQYTAENEFELAQELSAEFPENGPKMFAFYTIDEETKIIRYRILPEYELV